MTVQINEAALAQLFGVGGPVHAKFATYARRIQTTAQQLNPTNTRTGAYRGGFFNESRGGGTDWHYAIGNTAPHSTYIESGTRPHTIVPKRGKVLVFQAADGRTVFAREVHHPGTQAHRVLQRALETTPYR